MRSIKVIFVLFIMMLMSFEVLAAKPAVDPADNPERSCNAEADLKELRGNERKEFIKDCLEESDAPDESAEDAPAEK